MTSAELDTALIDVIIKLNDAFDVWMSGGFTKIGPPGTLGLMANPPPAEEVKAFADKYAMTIPTAEAWIAALDAMPQDQMDWVFGIFETWQKGAELTGLSLRDYAEQFVRGMGPGGRPPGHA